MAQVLDGGLAVGKRGAARRGLPGALLGAGLEVGGAAFAMSFTLAVQVPFLDQLFYVGPLVKPLGGADISWIAGFGVASLLYLAGARRFVHVQLGAAAAVGAAS